MHVSDSTLSFAPPCYFPPSFCLVAFLANLLLIISNVFTDCEALCNLLLKSAIQTKDYYSQRYFVIVSLNVKSVLLELS